MTEPLFEIVREDVADFDGVRDGDGVMEAELAHIPNAIVSQTVSVPPHGDDGSHHTGKGQFQWLCATFTREREVGKFLGKYPQSRLSYKYLNKI